MADRSMYGSLERTRMATAAAIVCAPLFGGSAALAGACDDINAYPPACGFDFEWWATGSCGGGVMGVDVYGINDEGTVVGRIDGCPTHTQYRILLWPAGQPTGQIINLPWSVSEWATDINNTGQITLRVSSNGASIAIMDGDEITVLPKPEWAPVAVGGRINDLGDVVGTYGNNVTGPFPLVGRWQSPLHEHEDLSPSFEAIGHQVLGFNDAGQIVGELLLAGDEPAWARQRAFVYTDGVVTDLGIPPGALNSTAKGISEAGHVVGRGIGNPFGTPGFNAGHPYYSFIWKNGEFEMLEPYPSEAPIKSVDVYGINSAKIVIGSTFTFTETGQPFGGGTSASTVWYGGVPYRVQDLVDLPAGVAISAPRLVSETGIMAGAGAVSGQSGSIVYRLTPRHRPAADLNADCVVDGDDLMILLNQWGQRALRGTAPSADLNGDGLVDGADLGILLLNWTAE